MRELLLLLLCVSQHSMTGQIHEGEPDHAASPADSGAEEYLVDEGPVWRFGAQRQYNESSQAGMAELADAADLKSAGLKRPVGVRVPLSAP
jgi:hypothetical protein